MRLDDAIALVGSGVTAVVLAGGAVVLAGTAVLAAEVVGWTARRLTSRSGRRMSA